MNVALDTNAYSDFLRGEKSRVDIVRRATRLYLPLTDLPLPSKLDFASDGGVI